MKTESGEASANGTVALRAVRRLAILLIPFLVYLGTRGIPPFSRWSLNSLFVALLLILALFLRFEEGGYGAREIAVIGSLAAVGSAGRVLFAALPGVQPATFLAVLSGFMLGAEPGFMVGALIALLSNIFLGQGPWTPWQMLAWGAAGASGGLLSRFLGGRVKTAPLVILATLWGFLFGWIMNLWFWLSFVYPLNWASYLATCVSSFWFDLLHAGGNLAFALLLGRPMAAMLERYRLRFDFRYLGEGETTDRLPERMERSAGHEPLGFPAESPHGR